MKLLEDLEHTLSSVLQLTKRTEKAKRRFNIIKQKKEPTLGTDQPHAISPEEDETRV